MGIQSEEHHYGHEYKMNDIEVHYVFEAGISVGLDVHDKTEGTWLAVRRSKAKVDSCYMGRGVTREEAVANALRKAAASKPTTELYNET